MRVKGVIFDLDGTLLDSMKIWEDLGSRYLSSLLCSPEQGLNEILRSMSLSEAAEYFIEYYKVNKSVEDILLDIERIIEDFYYNQAKVKAGVLELLAYFKDENIPMVIATSSSRFLTIGALKNNNITSYFEKIFTCDEVGESKRSDKIYQQAADYLKDSYGMRENKEIYVFEDALFAMQTAKRAGFYVIGVYDKSEENHMAECRQSCDCFVDSLITRKEYLNV